MKSTDENERGIHDWNRHRYISDEDVAKRVKIATLRAQGWSEAEVADHVGVSRQRVNQLLQEIFKLTTSPVHTDTSTLGNRLRYVRTTMGLTLMAVGEKTGIHYISILRWEREKLVPQLDGLMNLIKFYGVDAHWVMFGYKHHEGCHQRAR